MNEENENLETAVDGGAPLNLAMFSKLSPGWQRVVIAVLFVIVLVIAVVIREMVKTEELASEEAGGA
ncbi:MAG: hypothetical protein H6659_11975 [Ardenticatenaceae bacterium]|nr:hypothetical protein [Anaerolineales bacterium]MCB8984537.1 hypothetical protein [Ardenticatenaceae bacterium]MCB8986164.1 hypothetical protein [Ardenticatenaceae bacterium]